MTDERFIVIDDGFDFIVRDTITGDTLIDADGVADVLNDYEKENEQLKKDLIDHSALISMLEDYQALKIEETLWNLTGAKSEEELNELYKPYFEKAKRCYE